MKITQQDRDMARAVFINNFHSNKSDEDIFYEMCFCICAPQTTFKNNYKVITELRRIDYYHFTSHQLYLEGSEEEFLWKFVKPVRFFRNKSKWLAEARRKFSDILFTLGSVADEQSKRGWLVQNVKGLGWKTASHFLRNLGLS